MTLFACLAVALVSGSPTAPDDSPFDSPSELAADTAAPTWSGTGLIVGGSLGVAAGITSFGFGSAGWADDPEQFETDSLNNAVAPMFDGLGAMLYLPGVAMLGSGMHLRGRSDAYADGGARFDQARVAVVAGGSLIGIAAGTIVVSRIAFHTSDGAGLRAGTALGVATHFGLAATTAGAMALGWGHGYRRATMDRRRLSFAPQLGRDTVGLSMSGRF